MAKGQFSGRQRGSFQTVKEKKKGKQNKRRKNSENRLCLPYTLLFGEREGDMERCRVETSRER